MELEGRIYKITNIITSKIYIGCTTKTIENRFLEHKSRSKSKKHNSKLYNSINKYGIDNFIIEEIYGDTANIEKEKRLNSGKQYWENCSDEDKNKRIDNQINTLIIKSGYSKELIHNVRKLKFEDKLKPKQIQKIYPELTINNINNITNKRRWNSIYQS